MSPESDLVHGSRLDVEVFADHVKQASHRHRHRTIETWQRERKLGQGGFGTVYLERCSEDQQKVRAVKQVDKRRGIDYSRELEAAALFSQSLYEATFVRSFGWYETPESVFLTMEYIPLGDLHAFMGSPFPEPEARVIISQVLEALDYMHERHFVHRDLKPENLMVCEKGPDWWIKVSDFGISKRAELAHQAMHTQVYSPHFVAPEVLDDAPEGYTGAVDIWSTGVIAFLLLTGSSTLFKTYTDLIRYGQLTRKLPVERLASHDVSSRGEAFVSLLLSPKPKDRPDVQLCLAHAWIKPPLANTDLDETILGNTTDEAELAQWTTRVHNDTVPSALNTGLDTGNSAESVPSATNTDLDTIPKPESISADTENTKALTGLTLDDKLPSESAKSAQNLQEGSTTSEQEAKEAKVSAIPAPSGDTSDRLGSSWSTIIECHLSNLSAIAFSSDSGSFATASSDGIVKLWDSKTGRFTTETGIGNNFVSGLAFSSLNPSLLGIRSTEELVVHDLATGSRNVQNVSVADGDNTELLARSHAGGIIFSPLEQKVGVMREYEASDFHHTTEWGKIQSFLPNFGKPLCMALSPKGDHVAIGLNDHRVKIFEIEGVGGKFTTSVPASMITLGRKSKTNPIARLAYAPDGSGRLAAISKNGLLDIYDQDHSVLWSGPIGPAYDITFSPDGLLTATADWDGDVTLREVSTEANEVTRFTDGYGCPALRVAFSPDGSLIAAGGPQTVYVWVVETKKLLYSQKMESAAVCDPFVFSQDGTKLAVALRGGRLELIDVPGLLKDIVG